MEELSYAHVKHLLQQACVVIKTLLVPDTQTTEVSSRDGQAKPSLVVSGQWQGAAGDLTTGLRRLSFVLHYGEIMDLPQGPAWVLTLRMTERAANEPHSEGDWCAYHYSLSLGTTRSTHYLVSAAFVLLVTQQLQRFFQTGEKRSDPFHREQVRLAPGVHLTHYRSSHPES